MCNKLLLLEYFRILTVKRTNSLKIDMRFDILKQEYFQNNSINKDVYQLKVTWLDHLNPCQIKIYSHLPRKSTKDVEANLCSSATHGK